MLPDGQEVLQITPLAESLIITHCKDHGVYTCSEDGCSFSTSSPSMLGLHKAQTHKIKNAPKKGVFYQYFCPHPGCYFNPESGRFFRTLDVLRVHYMKVHMEKKFKCSQCDKGFGLERDCLRHEKECGQSFTCPECGMVYNYKEALRMHCTAKGHKKPPELRPKPRGPSLKDKHSTAKTVAKEKPQSLDKNKEHLPVPILPKFSPQDKISLIVPSAPTNLTSTSNTSPNKSSLRIPAPIAMMIQKNDNSGTKNTNNNNNANSNIIIPPTRQNDSQTQTLPITIIHTSHPSRSSKKLLCDNVAQTINYSLPPKTKSKRHAPTQTRLSILEMAMKHSKIPTTKTSKATQKSLSGSTSRKRKTVDKKDTGTGTRKYKSGPKLTVATLTDPQRRTFGQNIGSQTISSILYQNEQRNMAVNTSVVHHLKPSMATQTWTGSTLLCLDQPQESQGNPSVAYQSPQTSHLAVPLVGSADSNTQTFSYLLTQVPNCHQLNNSETQTSLTPSLNSTTQTPQFSALDSSASLSESLNSTTQTPQFSALDSSTQTLDLNLDNSSSLLDELFPESSGINVNTQTFGCFSSDMMTQTLEQLAYGESHEMGTNTFDENADFMRNNMTTQTLDEMVDSITQTFDSHIADGATQTSLSADIMTQTFDILGTDIMTQTLDGVTISSNIGCNNTQPMGSQPVERLGLPPVMYDNLCQTDFQEFHYDNTASVHPQNAVIESGCMEMAETQTNQTFSADILSLMTENSISVQGDKTYEGVAVQTDLSQSAYASGVWSQATPNSLSPGGHEPKLPTCAGEVREMALQTEDVDLWELTAETDSVLLTNNRDHTTCLVNDGISEISNQDQHPVNNLFTDSMTQTLSFPEDDDMTLDALLSDMATQTFNEDDLSFDALLLSSNSLSLSSDFATQTPQTVAESSCQTPVPFCSETETPTTVKQQSPLLPTGLGNEERAWNTQVQSYGDFSREMALQTENEGLWETQTQTQSTDVDVQCCMTNSSSSISTSSSKTCTNTNTNTVETGSDSAMDIDDFRVVGIQCFENELWEMGTQTGGDNAWEMGTQTGGDIAWEMGTQTGGDNAWEMGTQTGGDIAWEMGTQTGGDIAWEMGTQTGLGIQTGGDNSWEMGTQTGGDNAWEMGTQTGLGIQTGGDNAWEMGTQTGGDNSWEMGTQTMAANLLTDTMTQTGDDLIDFLLTGGSS